MEENKITAITKEKTDVLKEAYKDTLEILDAYDHQTLTRPEGTYYDGDESIEEVAVGMLYDMIKNPVWYDCNKQMAAIKFLLFLEWNNALYVDGEKRYILAPKGLEVGSQIISGNETDIKVGNALALENTGKVWAWGLNNYGQLGNGSTKNNTIFKRRRELLL